ncbi:hypothetical protein MRX96_041570 [Rhipicephalus microplus]
MGIPRAENPLLILANTEANQFCNGTRQSGAIAALPACCCSSPTKQNPIAEEPHEHVDIQRKQGREKNIHSAILMSNEILSPAAHLLRSKRFAAAAYTNNGLSMRAGRRSKANQAQCIVVVQHGDTNGCGTRLGSGDYHGTSQRMHSKQREKETGTGQLRYPQKSSPCGEKSIATGSGFDARPCPPQRS